MRFAVASDALPSVRFEPTPVHPLARLGASELGTVATRCGNLVVHGPTGAWAYLTDEELAIARAADGALTSEVVAPGGWEGRETSFLLGLLVARGLLTADGHRRVAPAAIASDVAGTQRAFYLVLQLSRGCNLACRYCYWGHVAPSPTAEMTLDMAERAIAQAMERPEPRVQVDFGEVAVAEGLFRTILDRVIHAAAAAGKKLELSVQTNGTSIDDELVGLFREHRVFVSVSLDGPPELHDAARIQRGGRGSHARVVEGVRRLLEARIPHQVEVTVGRHNVHAPEAVVRHLIDLGVEDYLLKPILARGAAAEAWDTLGIDADEFAAFRRRAWRTAIAEQGIWVDQMLRNFLLRSLGAPAGWESGCTSRACNAGRAMVVVEPDGRLSACPRFLGVPTRDGGLVRLRRRHTMEVPLGPALRTMPAECGACLWQRLCGGGCTLAGQQTLADDDARIDPQCALHRADFELLFDEVLPHLVGGATAPRVGGFSVFSWARAGASVTPRPRRRSRA